MRTCHVLFLSVSVAVLGATMSACAQDGDAASGATDQDLAGAVVLLPEQADMVLDVANHAPASALVDLGLTTLQADAIVQGRAGADAVLGTGDDVRYKTIAQLDAVPKVSATVLKKLADFIDPFKAGNCDGAALLQGDLEAKAHALLGSAPDGGAIALNVGYLAYRSRTCDGGSCSAWSTSYAWIPRTNGQGSTETTPLAGMAAIIAPSPGATWVHFGGPSYPGASVISSVFDEASCGVDGGVLSCPRVTFQANVDEDPAFPSELHFRSAAGAGVALTGKIASTCLQASSEIQSTEDPSASGARIEEQAAVLVRWWDKSL